jgi:hypothetical protein
VTRKGRGVMGRKERRVTKRILPLLVVLLIGVPWAASSCGSPATTTTSLAVTTTVAVQTTTSTTPTTEATTTTTAPPTGNETIIRQQSDARFVYSGTWKTVSATGASGKSLAYANASGCSVTISFIGTHFAWIAKESPAYGQAKVTVDGGSAQTVDLYNAKTLWKQTVWETDTLSKDAHTVTIAWTGKKNTAATDTNINVDAISIAGVVTGRHQQDNAKLVYEGTWGTTSSKSASGGSFDYVDASGASVTINFFGLDLAWIAKKGPAYGQATVTVDGGAPTTVDLYSSKVGWQQRVWSTGILDMGAHTVKIEWAGTKSKGATGTNINLDAIDVTGTLK